MKHILYLLIIISQSCCAMNSQQTTEDAFRQKLQHYLDLPNIETSRDLSEKEKQHFYKIVRPATQPVPQEKMQYVWQEVELHAKTHNILDQLQAIVQRTNKFARDTSNILAAEVLNQEIDVILRTSWIAAFNISKENGKSTKDLIVEGLANCMKDRTAGKELSLILHKKELLCYLLLAYGGAPNATFLISTTLPHYTIVD